jgi:hypothetical protein
VWTEVAEVAAELAADGAEVGSGEGGKASQLAWLTFGPFHPLELPSTIPAPPGVFATNIHNSAGLPHNCVSHGQVLCAIILQEVIQTVLNTLWVSEHPESGDIVASTTGPRSLTALDSASGALCRHLPLAPWCLVRVMRHNCLLHEQAIIMGGTALLLSLGVSPDGKCERIHRTARVLGVSFSRRARGMTRPSRKVGRATWITFSSSCVLLYLLPCAIISSDI